MGDEKWNTVLINPGTVEVLDENKKTVLKAKTKERMLKKQESLNNCECFSNIDNL